MTNLDPRVLLAVLLIAVVALLASRRSRPVPDVVAKAFLTGNEAEFLGRLERALPECRIHAQVAMGALLRPRRAEGGGRSSRSVHASIRGRFDRKIVDFVVQARQGGRILAIVELDDRTHVPARDKARDAMMRRAGYTTIRWESKRKPGAVEIRRRVMGS